MVPRNFKDYLGGRRGASGYSERFKAGYKEVSGTFREFRGISGGSRVPCFIEYVHGTRYKHAKFPLAEEAHR